ncbi:MAG: putative nitrogen fixation protein NifT [Synechococcales cyanobacterium RM1_1_8]|nr:putative nitrogen fixation protein NifT [Synechococcales cyanobacterium RM1_1_8]
MKITLHTNSSGQLMIYVPKKDLEEEVITQIQTDDAQIFTLSNGWQLSVDGLTSPFATPQTVRARRLQ